MKKLSPIVIYSIITATIALLIAVVPSLVFEHEINTLEKESIEYRKKYSITIKGLEVGFSNGEKSENYKEKRENIERLEKHQENFKVIAFILGGLAVVVSLFSLIKSGEKRISISCLVAATVAVLWHYIVAGVMLGVGVFILLVFIVNFGC